MRISDWSSDVCSSDLRPFGAAGQVDFLADVRWDACDFSAHAPHRLHGHAPAGVYLPARPRLGDNEPPFHGRRFYPWDGRAPLRGRSHQEFPRSEEHTSELQSLMRISYAVFCLKKKKNTNTIQYFIKYLTTP